MSGNDKKQIKFPVAAIFFLIISTYLLIGYFRWLPDIIREIRLYDRFERHDAYYYSVMITYFRYALSVFPILSYVFFAIVLLMRKTGKLLIVSVIVMVVTHAGVGAFRFPLFFIEFSATGLGGIVFAFLGICALSKWGITVKNKKLFGWLLLAAYVLSQISNVTSSVLVRADFVSRGDCVWYVFFEVVWTALVVVACAFFMAWIYNPYKDEKDDQTCEAQVDAGEMVCEEKTTVLASVEQRKENEFQQLFDLKELLDKGIITQEEFDAKKKQILGL